jgi:hypothetical protein
MPVGVAQIDPRLLKLGCRPRTTMTSVQRDADGVDRLPHGAGHLHIRLGPRRVAGEVVVHHDLDSIKTRTRPA